MKVLIIIVLLSCIFGLLADQTDSLFNVLDEAIEQVSEKLPPQAKIIIPRFYYAEDPELEKEVITKITTQLKEKGHLLLDQLSTKISFDDEGLDDETIEYIIEQSGAEIIIYGQVIGAGLLRSLNLTAVEGKTKHNLAFTSNRLSSEEISFSDNLIQPDPTLLTSGESFVYSVKWGFITAGTATFNTLRSKYEGHDVWKTFTTAQTNHIFKIYYVKDYIESIAEFPTLYSLKFTKNLHEGTYRQYRIHTNFLFEKYSIYSRFNHKKEIFTDTQLEIPRATFDMLSAFNAIRTVKLEPGQSLTINVIADGKSYQAVVSVLRRETINTILGKKDCLVLEPGLLGDALFKQTGTILIYVTDDEHKIPVLLASKISIGSIKAVLKEIKIIDSSN